MQSPSPAAGRARSRRRVAHADVGRRARVAVASDAGCNMVKKQPTGKRRAEPTETEDDAASSLAALTLSATPRCRRPHGPKTPETRAS